MTRPPVMRRRLPAGVLLLCLTATPAWVQPSWLPRQPCLPPAAPPPAWGQPCPP